MWKLVLRQVYETLCQGLLNSGTFSVLQLGIVKLHSIVTAKGIEGKTGVFESV